MILTFLYLDLPTMQHVRPTGLVLGINVSQLEDPGRFLGAKRMEHIDLAAHDMATCSVQMLQTTCKAAPQKDARMEGIGLLSPQTAHPQQPFFQDEERWRASFAQSA